MKGLFFCILTLLSLWLLSGCMAALPYASMALKAGTLGTELIKAAPREEPPAEKKPVPNFITYPTELQTVKNAVLEVLADSGDQIDQVSKSTIKTARKSPDSSGSNQIATVKTITLKKLSSTSTKVTIKIKPYPYTSSAEWMAYEKDLRGTFYTSLSKKINPPTQAIDGNVLKNYTEEITQFHNGGPNQ